LYGDLVEINIMLSLGGRLAANINKRHTILTFFAYAILPPPLKMS
jgi:hypothetical protein